MAWMIAVAVLALLVVLFHTLYWRALTEGRHLRNYALLILLDETVYAAQRRGLSDLVQSIDAKNAGELGSKVNLALDSLAARLGHTLLGVAGLLWKLKNSPRT
jgi:hypothetical protein